MVILCCTEVHHWGYTCDVVKMVKWCEINPLCKRAHLLLPPLSFANSTWKQPTWNLENNAVLLNCYIHPGHWCKLHPGCSVETLPIYLPITPIGTLIYVGSNSLCCINSMQFPVGMVWMVDYLNCGKVLNHDVLNTMVGVASLLLQATSNEESSLWIHGLTSKALT